LIEMKIVDIDTEK